MGTIIHILHSGKWSLRKFPKGVGWGARIQIWTTWLCLPSELTVHFFSFNSHDTFSPSKDGYPPICGTLLASLQISSVKTEEKERALLA